MTKKLNRKQREAKERAESDHTAQAVGRTDIRYDLDELPTPRNQISAAPPTEDPALGTVSQQSDKEQHHELCLGVLARCYPYVPAELKLAIQQGIEQATELGFPVDTRNLGKGGPLFKGGNA